MNAKSNTILTCVSIALICLMLSSLTVQSSPGEAEFGLWAVLNNDPYWGGYGGGCHDIMYKMRPQLAEIGVNVDVYIQGDMWANWELIWKAGLGGAGPGKAPYGWDIHIMDWWLHRVGFLWMDSIMLSKCITPLAYNINPYVSERNDELYWKMQTSLDPVVRRNYAFAWQAELMHNPPVATFYYPITYNLRSRYIKNYDSSTWWYDLSGLSIDTTGLEDKLSTTVLNRLNTEKTLIYGASEPWTFYLTTFADSYTDEQDANLVSGSLYKISLDWATHEDGKPGENYYLKPWLASDYPTPVDGEEVEWLDSDGEMVYRVKIPLREGVVWSDDDPFDAKDVWFSVDIITNPETLSSGWGDFAPIVKRAEYVDTAGNLHKATGRDDTPLNWDPNTIALICHDPYADLNLILANVWGTGIIPAHAVGPIVDAVGASGLRGHDITINFDYAKANLPSIGPYKYDAQGPVAGYDWIRFARNPNFFGYDASIVGEPAWGPYDVQKMIIKYMPDSPVRLTAIRTHEIDWAEYPVTAIEQYEELKATDPTLLIYQAPETAGNHLWFNFNNPYLSNRYVRLALCHAIPYKDIMENLLPGWGIVGSIPGISFVLPWHVYVYEGGEISLFNTDLEPYEFDLTKAQMYLDMWYYSQEGFTAPADRDKGAVGDANFDGIVNTDDLWLWLTTWGEKPLTHEIDWWDPDWSGGVYPWPVAEGASVAPGNDIDADFNNGGTVGSEDFPLWLAHWGDEYPFEGAR